MKLSGLITETSTEQTETSTRKKKRKEKNNATTKYKYKQKGWKATIKLIKQNRKYSIHISFSRHSRDFVELQ